MSNKNRKFVAPRGNNQPPKNMMESSATIAEVVQISRATAEDVVSDYSRHQYNAQVAMSLQIEIMKDILFSSGMITEEEFKKRYMEEADKLQKMQMEMMNNMQEDNSAVTASMEMSAGDVEVKVEK